MYKSTTLISLAALAVAAPLPGSPPTSGQVSYGQDGKPVSTYYRAGFDDLTPVLGGIVSIQEVGPYDGLDYNNINLISLGLSGSVVAGVNPESPPNVGSYSDRSISLEGGAAPSISTQYIGSVTDTFDFSSFYFGCVVATGEAAASVPTSCTVTVTGYKATKQIAQQSFDFNPGVAVTADMVKANLNGFKGIDTATFDTSAGDVVDTSAITATLLDDLVYTVYDAQQDNEEYGEEKEETKTSSTTATSSLLSGLPVVSSLGL